MTHFGRMLVVMLLAAGLSGCHVYSGEVIEGWVVDEETKQPLKGAVVTAVWEIYGGAVHGSVIGNLLAQEAVTDEKGHFVLGAWGPKFVFWDALYGPTPTLIVFHKDYYFTVVGHEDPRRLRPPPSFTMETRGCSCSGNALALRRFDTQWTSFEENARLAALPLGLLDSRDSYACTWEWTPRFTAELLRRRAVLDKHNIYNSLPSIDMLDRSGQCADPEQVLGALK